MSDQLPPEIPDPNIPPVPPVPTPPPAGDYGTTPTPPPPGSYGPPPPGYQVPATPAMGAKDLVNGPYAAGDAFSYGWLKFTQNAVPILTAAVVLILGLLLVEVVGYLIFSGLLLGTTATTIGADGTVTFGSTPGLFAVLLFGAVLFGLFIVLQYIVQAGITRGALALTKAQPLTSQLMFTTEQLGPVIVAGLIVGVAAAIGYVLCFLPGLAVLFFTQFTVYFIVDKQLGAMDAIKASVAFVQANMGALVVFFLISLLAYFVGFLLCGIGLIVAIPVILIAQAYTYRKLQGETVAA